MTYRFASPSFSLDAKVLGETAVSIPSVGSLPQHDFEQGCCHRFVNRTGEQDGPDAGSFDRQILSEIVTRYLLTYALTGVDRGLAQARGQGEEARNEHQGSRGYWNRVRLDQR